MKIFHRVAKKLLLILTIAGLTYIILTLNRVREEKEEEECSVTLSEFGKYDRCFDGDLYGSWRGAGMGNRIFEIVTFLGLSRKYQRVPTISNNRTMKQQRHISKWFPNIDAQLDAFEGRTCLFENKSVIKVNAVLYCCKVDQKAMKALDNATNLSGINLQTAYTQGIDYVKLLPSCYVKKLLRGTDKIIETAEKELFPPVWLREYKKNLCMHLRNGDFHASSDVFPADKAFTRAATDYIISKELFPVDIYIFGDDRKFNEDVFRGWNNVYIASVNSSRPPNTEWEFSRLYCDIFLLPSSASTYGWWAAYLSRGQQVYYNANYSKPTRGIAKQLNPWEFWPADWIALNFTSQKRIVEVKLF